MDCVAVNEVGLIPASGADWLREIKWDGYRVCIVKIGHEVSFRTKSNLPPGARYQHIEESLSASKLLNCVLDAELVAVDPEGHPSFQLLQQSRHNDAEVVVYVFDILNYDGRNLMHLELESRREVLDALASRFPQYVRLSELLPADASISALVAAINEQRLEGIIVKRKTSRYREGSELGTWIKYRLYKIGEFVIGGYLKRHDLFFDALIVGERKEGKLVYKEKVRFGFDDEKKADLLARMDAMRLSRTPFDNLPERNRRGSLDAEEMREAVWVRPDLRCTVEYTERTKSGNIRGHGRFGELLNG
jgi:bifunctional non-homologous end joining protein LigD